MFFELEGFKFRWLNSFGKVIFMIDNVVVFLSKKKAPVWELKNSKAINKYRQ
jgi:hypothetical protein